MNIAILRSSLHKGSGQVLHITELVRGLQRQGHTGVIFTRETEIKAIDVHIRKQGFLGDNIRFLRNFVFPFRCLSSLAQFDIIHTQYHPGLFVGDVAKVILRKPHVFTFHGFAPTEFWRNPYQRMKMVDHRIGTFLSLRLGVDKIITVSRFLKKELTDSYKVAEKKIHVVYNSIDIERFNPQVSRDMIKREYGLGNAPIVLYLGRLAPYKGVHYLIRAIPQILRRNPDAKFLIAGSRRYDMLNLPGMAESLGVSESVIFTGYVPDELVPLFYACCDVFCYPSQWEGFGLPVAEAGATGKPVVALRTCAIPEVVEDGVTGLLVPPIPTQLASAVNTLLENAGMRKKMGQEARKRVSQRFSQREMVNRTLEVYKEVL